MLFQHFKLHKVPNCGNGAGLSTNNGRIFLTLAYHAKSDVGLPMCKDSEHSAMQNTYD